MSGSNTSNASQAGMFNTTNTQPGADALQSLNSIVTTASGLLTQTQAAAATAQSTVAQVNASGAAANTTLAQAQAATASAQDANTQAGLLMSQTQALAAQANAASTSADNSATNASASATAAASSATMSSTEATNASASATASAGSASTAAVAAINASASATNASASATAAASSASTASVGATNASASATAAANSAASNAQALAPLEAAVAGCLTVAQAQQGFAQLSGSKTQPFFVADATDPQQSTPLNQTQSLISAAIVPYGVLLKGISQAAVAVAGVGDCFAAPNGYSSYGPGSKNAPTSGCGLLYTFSADGLPSSTSGSSWVTVIAYDTSSPIPYISNNIEGGGWSAWVQLGTMQGNANQTFAVGNAKQSNQAVALGQLAPLKPLAGNIGTVIVPRQAGGVELTFTNNFPGILIMVGNINTQNSSGLTQMNLYLNGAVVGGDDITIPATTIAQSNITPGTQTVSYNSNGAGRNGDSAIYVSFIFLPLPPGVNF